ncbi:SCO family protein [Leeuwenhoekiella marinoflava]|uniref:Protein SCO1/2 n=2 Tax=Leeuwenhoekiella marinoflava TaxID=988 RepID=A0A4Q0PBP8_9FLAO|nr:SCO family protein [Leeuwenhoekiella marinoflava]RXG24167.1 protein SCO1/2 [Leeuwenhoekiella marinoflava]SHF93024.1 protein SCO1/2 [Leeuwenhoekiella marinoflava DSM 3653]
MLQFFARYKKFAIVMAVLSIIILYTFYTLMKPAPSLPIYQPDMVDRSLVDSTVQFVKKYHKIADFKLVNQNGDTITQDDYPGIYVADFFFTTCQTICPIMTEHMVQIQEKLKDDPSVKLLSHTVIPATDTVAQLKRYALEKGVDDSRWNLVTGPKKEIYELARKSYLAVKTQGNGDKYDMIHTENFMLIDSKKRIRGFYDGTDPEAIEQLLEDIKILKAIEKRSDD